MCVSVCVRLCVLSSWIGLQGFCSDSVVSVAVCREAAQKHTWMDFNNSKTLNPSGFYKTSNPVMPQVTYEKQQRNDTHTDTLAETGGQRDLFSEETKGREMYVYYTHTDNSIF